MKSNKHLYVIILIIFIGVTISCKKNKDSGGTPVTPVDSSTAAKAARDSALLRSKDFYLWYNQVPSTFDPQSYADPNAVMVGLRAYSIETGFNLPVDKWSFGVLKTDWNQLSGGFGTVNNTLTTGDFGLSVFFFADKDLRVKLVERLSPAGLAGIQRGWRIKSINGNESISTAANDITFIVKNVYNSANTTFTFIKPDNTTVDISLTATEYPQQTVYLDTVYNRGSKTVGYMVLNSFLGDTSQIFSDFDRVMNNFAAQSVTDIIIDLRYNGGGYVSVQEKLADYLAPASANGSVMMKETYNDKHQDYNATLYFNKTGPLNPNHVLFIVTLSTASASELLINNLKPYMDVKIVGPNNTDGKPVGFFPLSAGDWYVFPVSFRSTNGINSGGYFNGFAPDAQVVDGLNKDWGDPNESCLAEGLKYITTGSFRLQAPEVYKVDPAVTAGNHSLDKRSFKGSIDTRGMR
ncbi:MAG: S41 family peptidase [Ginsengibacter sp.]